MKINITHILLCVIVISITLALIIQFIPDNVSRIILGLPFALLFPGFTLISALFPRKGSLDGIERLALSFGMSIAVVPLIGLGLNYTPWGIQLSPILISLTVFIVLMAAIALYRGHKLLPNEQISLRVSFKPPSFADSWNKQTTGGKMLSVLLMIAITGAVGTLIYVANQPNTPDTFTEFYVLNSEGMASDYPDNIILGENGTVILGIINHEYEATVYNISITIDGTKAGEITDITLENEETWEQEVIFTPIHTGANQKTEFRLYKGTDKEAYESLHLWIEVRQE